MLYDLRTLRPPSRAALRYGIDWMGTDANKADLEEQVQGVVVLVASPIVRTVARGVVAACRPPHPVHICADEATAIAYARGFTAEGDGEPPVAAGPTRSRPAPGGASGGRRIALGS